MRTRSKLIELYNRIVSPDYSDKKIYRNGDNNLYPNEIERIINNSPTAKRGALLMARYVGGNGLVDSSQDIIVNAKKNLKVTDIISSISLNIAYQNGAFIHIGYGIDDDAKIIPKSINVLDYLKCRKSKEDDEDNYGKIYYRDYEQSISWFNSKSNSDKQKWFYPYNPNQEVLIEQIKKDYIEQSKDENAEFDLKEGIKKYRGQVYYLNLSNYVYSLSPIDSVYNDADSEYGMSLYTNKQIRSGFMGKTVIMTNGLDEEVNKEIENNIKKFLGAENSDSVWHLDLEPVMDINNVIKIEQLKAQFDDKIFIETKKDLRKNILGCFNNIPEPLISAGEGALFGTSGETYTEMKKFYSEQTKLERDKIEQTLNMFGFPCAIKEIGMNE